MITATRVLCSAILAALASLTAAQAQTPPATPQPKPEAAKPQPKPEVVDPEVAEPPPAPEIAESPPQPENAASPPQPEATELDAVVVTGLRQSLESAQTIKQDSDQIIDSIVAEDIGKLPDITASASLARVTGVQVNRAAGEAAQVQVRGLPDLTTTYNGREIFTAEGRNVALQDFPAGGVAGLDVYKSSTADLIEGGIAGLINVRSRRPFGFKGFEMFGAANGIYTDQANKRDLNGSFLISNRWDTGMGEMGLLLNVAWNRIRFLDSTREQSLVVGFDRSVPRQVGFRYPDAVATFYGEGQRERPSVNAAFQWKPSDELELNADFLFQGFRGRDSDRFMFVPLFGGGLSFSDVVLQPGTNQAQSLTATGGEAPNGFQQSLDSNTDTYQFGVGAVWRRDGVRWSGDIAYTDSEFTQQQANIDYALVRAPVRDVNFDVPGDDGGPTFSFRDFDLTNPANFRFRGLFDRNYEASGDDVQARTDFEYTPESGFFKALQTGLRYNDRGAERRNGERFGFVQPAGLLYTDLPVDLELIGPGFRGDDDAPPRVWVSPTRDSIRWNIEALRRLTDSLLPASNTLFDNPGAPPFSDFETFVATEKAYAAYVQFKYEFDIGVPVDGAVGLRAVQTETEVSGTSREQVGNVVTFTPVTSDNDYIDYLPNASARFRFTDKFQVRLGATRTRTRPNFDQLNPSTSFAPPSSTCISNPQAATCIRFASSGNPDLEPLESDNYDLSFEYYFAPTGSATLALFRRDVSGFISRFDVDQPGPGESTLRLNRPENGGEGRLQGVEAAFTTFLDYDFVPEWANAFGLQANYTYIDHGAELGPTLAASLPGEPRIPGVSKNAYNLILLYEKPVFSARLAYNWRSKYVDAYARINDPVLGTIDPVTGFPRGAPGPTLPLVQDDRGVLDFSMNYTPIPALTFAFDVSNILGDPITRSRAYNAAGDTYPRQVKYLERVYSLGVRFRFR